MKSEVRFTAWLIKLGAEVCKVKLKGTIDKEKKDALVSLIDRCMEAYDELWHFRNLDRGINKFMDTLIARRKEILEMA